MNKNLMLIAALGAGLFLMSRSSLSSTASNAVQTQAAASKAGNEYAAHFIGALGTNPNFRASQYGASLNLTGNPFADYIVSMLPGTYNLTQDLGWGTRTWTVPLDIQIGDIWRRGTGQAYATDVKKQMGTAHIM